MIDMYRINHTGRAYAVKGCDVYEWNVSRKQWVITTLPANMVRHFADLIAKNVQFK